MHLLPNEPVFRRPRLSHSVRTVLFALRRRVDSLWGYDVFIAHRRSDAADYARAVHDRLHAERISSFIDKVVYAPGDSLLVATHRHVAKSTLFLLVGSPELLRPRQPLDWVEREIETYLRTHEADPKLIVVDICGVVEVALADPQLAAGPAYPILRYLEPFVRLREPNDALQKPPSDKVLAAIRRNLDGRRRERTRLRFFEAVAVFLLLLVGIASWQWRVADARLERANQALAAGLWSDLNLLPDGKRDDELSPGARQALWRLTVADSAVRDIFAEQAAQKQENLQRFARRPELVARALGLERPSPAEAERIMSVIKDRRKGALNAELVSVLAPKLGNAQAQSALVYILGHMLVDWGDESAYAELAAAVQALGPRLDEAQSKAVLADLLRKIRQTDYDAYLPPFETALKALAPNLANAEAQVILRELLEITNGDVSPTAVRALAPRLGEADAQTVLTPMLQQIEINSTDDTVREFAGAVQALGPKLSDTQAQTALTPVLQRIEIASTNVEIKSTDLTIRELVGAIKALAPQLSETQSEIAFAQLLQTLGNAQSYETFERLSATIQTLAPRLNETQSETAFAQLLQKLRDTTPPPMVVKAEGQTLHTRVPIVGPRGIITIMSPAIRELAVRLSETEVRAGLGRLLQQLRESSSETPLVSKAALVVAVRALATRLSDTEANTLLESLLQELSGNELSDNFDRKTLSPVTAVLPVLAPKLIDRRVQAAFEVLYELPTSGDLLFALAPELVPPFTAKLTESQVQAVLEQLVRDARGSRYFHDSPAAEVALLRALTPLLSQAQAQRVLDPLLQEFRDFAELRADKPDAAIYDSSRLLLVEALAPSFSEAQAQAVVAQLLPEIATFDYEAPPSSLAAAAVQALAPKLSTAVLSQVRPVVRSALAWSASSQEAIAWAKAYVQLWSVEPPETLIKAIVEALKFAPAAGAATDVLLDTLRDRAAGAPGIKQGLQATTKWLRQAYPSLDLQIRPLCPEPTPAGKAVGLTCPPQQ